MNNLQWPHFFIRHNNIKNYSFFIPQRAQRQHCARHSDKNAMALSREMNGAIFQQASHIENGEILIKIEQLEAENKQQISYCVAILYFHCERVSIY